MVGVTKLTCGWLVGSCDLQRLLEYSVRELFWLVSRKVLSVCGLGMESEEPEQDSGCQANLLSCL